VAPLLLSSGPSSPLTSKLTGFLGAFVTLVSLLAVQNECPEGDF
jgi:hypothetical protein